VVQAGVSRKPRRTDRVPRGVVQVRALSLRIRLLVVCRAPLDEYPAARKESRAELAPVGRHQRAGVPLRGPRFRIDVFRRHCAWRPASEGHDPGRVARGVERKEDHRSIVAVARGGKGCAPGVRGDVQHVSRRVRVPRSLPRKEHLPVVRQEEVPREQRWSESVCKGGLPARPRVRQVVDLRGGVEPARAVDSGERHDTAIGQRGRGGVPAPVGHALRLVEVPRRGVMHRGALVSLEGVIRASSDDQWPAVRKDRRAAAKDIVVDLRHVDAAEVGSGRVPDRGPVALRARRVVIRVVLRAGDDEDLPSVQQGGRDRVHRHLIRESRPRSGDVRDVVGAVLGSP